MNKLIKPFRGVCDGGIYPTEFAAGEECPPELIAGARSVGALPTIPFASVDLGPLSLVGPGFLAPAPGNEGAAPNSGDLSTAGGTDSTASGGGSGGGQSGGQDSGTSNAQDAGQVGSSAGEPAQDKTSLIAALEAAEIPFDKRWGPEKLAAALASGKKE